MSSIKDVARLAGVSTATVSRTLSDPDKVTEETRRKVQVAIRRSGYVANALARSFRTQRTQTILVLVPDIGNPFYSLIIQGLEEVAQQYNYRILVGDTQNLPERETEYLQGAMERQVDGIISLGHTLPVLETRKGMPSIPLIMACEYLCDGVVPSVSIDNVAAAAMATQHLLELGHRKIVFINGPVQTPLSRDRLLGYRRALKLHKVPYDKARIFRGDFSLQSGEQAAQALLASKVDFTAVFCASDAMAIGAIKVLRGAGIAVPRDVSVVGFDDIEFANYVEPPLTTIHQPRREIGRATMQLMIDRLMNDKENARAVVLQHSLIVRSSTISLVEG